MMDILLEVLINANNPDILYTIHSRLPLDFYIPLIDHRFSKKWVFIGNRTYRNGKLHSFDDQPTVITSNGDKEWWKNGKCHRDNDLPAIVCSDGTQQHWYQNGKLHRDNDKPATIWSDGTQEWWKNSKCHRDNDLPARIYSNGTQVWYQNGKLLSRVIKAS